MARAVGENVRALVPTLTRQSRSEVGRKSTAVALAAAVPFLDDSGVPDVRYAEFLGVDNHRVAEARRRRTAADTAAAGGISAKAALVGGVYLYQERKRTDAALPQEMEQCITDFWHSDGGPARASGNTKEVVRESKARDAAAHPVRHMQVTGEQAYLQFLQFEPYLELRGRLRRGDGTLWWGVEEHLSRSTFLNRRCWCIKMVSEGVRGTQTHTRTPQCTPYDHKVAQRSLAHAARHAHIHAYRTQAWSNVSARCTRAWSSSRMRSASA
jgi:hypothetical protein